MKTPTLKNTSLIIIIIGSIIFLGYVFNIYIDMRRYGYEPSKDQMNTILILGIPLCVAILVFRLKDIFNKSDKE
jgi:hypothetical protein